RGVGRESFGGESAAGKGDQPAQTEDDSQRAHDLVVPCANRRACRGIGACATGRAKCPVVKSFTSLFWNRKSAAVLPPPHPARPGARNPAGLATSVPGAPPQAATSSRCVGVG